MAKQCAASVSTSYGRHSENVFPLYEDGNSYVMHTYYASLVRGLRGYGDPIILLTEEWE
jgi:hypothetical protein